LVARPPRKFRKQIREATEAAARGESIRATLPYMWGGRHRASRRFRPCIPFSTRNGQILFSSPYPVWTSPTQNAPKKNYRSPHRILGRGSPPPHSRARRTQRPNCQAIGIAAASLSAFDESAGRGTPAVSPAELHDSRRGNLLSGLKMSLGAIVSRHQIQFSRGDRRSRREPQKSSSSSRRKFAPCRTCCTRPACSTKIGPLRRPLALVYSRDFSERKRPRNISICPRRLRAAFPSKSNLYCSVLIQEATNQHPPDIPAAKKTAAIRHFPSTPKRSIAEN